MAGSLDLGGVGCLQRIDRMDAPNERALLSVSGVALCAVRGLW